MSRPIPLDLSCPVSRERAVADLHRDNAFLGQLLSAMLRSYPDARCRFRIPLARALVAVLYRAGAVDRIRGFEAFDDPMLFWDLLEAARAEDPAGGLTLPLRGLWCLYQKVAFNHEFSESFIRHPKSIHYLIGRTALLDLVADHGVTRDNYFAVMLKAARRYFGHPVILRFRSPYLQSRLFVTVRDRELDFYFSRVAATTALVEGFERYFENPEEIRSFEDFTPVRFAEAVAAIRRFHGVATPECRCAMKVLFLLWSDLMHDFPDHDFFAGSLVYSAETVLSITTPTYLSLGYNVRVVGREGELPPEEKVLFLVRRDNRRTSIRREYHQRAVDFSRIRDLVWRKAVVNYAQECLMRGNEARFGNVIEHLEQFFKVRPKGDADHHFTAFDYRLMRSVIIANRGVMDISKAGKFTILRGFIIWASSRGYITVEKEFWKAVRGIRFQNRRTPSGMSQEEIAKLDAAFEELGRHEARFLLDRCVMHIQLHSQVRTGQICSLLVSELSWNDDGSCDAWQLTKTSGRSTHDNYMSPQAAEWLRCALDISRPLREACPVGTLKDSVFLYRNVHRRYRSNTYHAVTTTSFCSDLVEACKVAGIRHLSSGNVRDTGTTARKMLAVRLGMTALETGAFVGHASPMSTNAYQDLDFREVLQAADGITIGSV